MWAVIGRSYQPKQTPGCFVVIDEENVVAQVKSLELPYLQNQRKISCIPPGEYECERIQHLKYGLCWWVKDVPSRDGILIHTGNYASDKRKLSMFGRLFDYLKRLINYHWYGIPMEPLNNPRKVDTEGCIMPGMRFMDINNDGNLDVAESTEAMNILRGILPEKFKLIIR